MTLDLQKGRAALRRGRWSLSGAEYFLTICTESKRSGLNAPTVADGIMQEVQALQVDGSWAVRCATVMPDHAHVFTTLGQRLSLGRTLQRLKGKTAASLRLHALRWERGFLDRQMRPEDDCLAIFLYIFINPYRGGLIAKDGKWPHYFCCKADWSWFSSCLDQELPQPEWLTG